MKWMGWGLLVISPDMVAERHYFLEWLQTPVCMWLVRIIAVIAGIAVLVVYKKTREKDGE